MKIAFSPTKPSITELDKLDIKSSFGSISPYVDRSSNWGGRRPGTGHKKGQVMPKTLEKMKVKEAMDQQLMRLTEKLVMAQATLALGQMFLFKIEKTWVSTGKNKGYYRNGKPVQLTSDEDIENYLAMDAENNGDINNNQDGATAYYYITAKEPNGEAIKNIFDRVFGRPKESVEHSGSTGFSLMELFKKAEERDKEEEANKK